MASSLVSILAPREGGGREGGREGGRGRGEGGRGGGGGGGGGGGRGGKVTYYSSRPITCNVW